MASQGPFGLVKLLITKKNFLKKKAKPRVTFEKRLKGRIDDKWPGNFHAD